MKSVSRTLSALALLPFCVSAVHAQTTWDRLALIAKPKPDKGNGKAAAIEAMKGMSVEESAKSLAVFRMTSQSLTIAHARFMQTLDDSRTDKQVVAGSAAGGTGDPVSMPGLADLLAYAVSAGAVTQTVNQNVVTLSANADGIYKFIAGQNPACSGRVVEDKDAAKVQDSCTPPTWAHNLAVSAAFNIGGSSSQTVTGQSAATGTTQSALASVNGKDFSSASARYAFTNTRSTNSRKSTNKFRLKIDPNQKFFSPVAVSSW